MGCASRRLFPSLPPQRSSRGTDARAAAHTQYKKAPEDTWGRDGKNVFVLEEVDTQAFWREVFLETVARADEVVPVNAAWREKRRDEEERARRAGKA